MSTTIKVSVRKVAEKLRNGVKHFGTTFIIDPGKIHMVMPKGSTLADEYAACNRLTALMKAGTELTDEVVNDALRQQPK